MGHVRRLASKGFRYTKAAKTTESPTLNNLYYLWTRSSEHFVLPIKQ